MGVPFLLGFLCSVWSISSMIVAIFLLASLRVSRCVLKISFTVIFRVFSLWICGHSLSVCCCVCPIFAHSAFYVLVFVSLVVHYIQHSRACFEDCTGLFPNQFF